MKPMILISPDDTYDPDSHRPLYLIKRSYTTAISGAGGLAVMPVEPRFYDTYAEIAAGLLLTDGSENINPGRFGEAAGNGYGGKSWYDYDFAYFRDSMDITLCRAFLNLRKPVMGIGRGMQIINIVLGGTLYQNLAAHYENDHPVGRPHRVVVKEGSRLSALIGSETMVNSYHHQGVRRLGTGLEAVAHAGDGLVEAIWHEELPVFGVQWNPETYMTDDEELLAKNKLSVEEQEEDPVVAERFKELHKIMRPMDGVRTDRDIPLPTDNALFNCFVDMCRKEVYK